MNKVGDNPDREVFVALINSELITGFVVYRFYLKYRRYRWEVEKRFHEVQSIDRRLRRKYPNEMAAILKPPRYSKFLYTHDAKFLEERGRTLCAYLQTVCDNKTIFYGTHLRRFLDIGANAFNPEYGRKGHEGFLKKCSGGYIMSFSRRPGDFLSYWRQRWIVIHDNYIAWYRYPEDLEPRGILQLDSSLDVVLVGRILSVRTNTRKLTMSAPTRRIAEEWQRALHAFYRTTPRRLILPYNSSFPPRDKTDVRVYTLPKDYMAAAAVAMLGAQKEIFICSWKNSPCVQLTRPPDPPLRLDQLLKFKAEQGVRIYILLYKEVEMAGQGNDSGKAQNYLESLHPNILCVRHPNKFVGGSTAVLWSHHEKLVVVDRNVAFVGGIDLAFNRWCDAAHHVADEDGILFPGRDYRQPAEGMFKPVRVAVSVAANCVKSKRASAGASSSSSSSNNSLTSLTAQYEEQSRMLNTQEKERAYAQKAVAVSQGALYGQEQNHVSSPDSRGDVADDDNASEDGDSRGDGLRGNSFDSENMSEDRYEPLSAAEEQARRQAELQVQVPVPADPYIVDPTLQTSKDTLVGGLEDVAVPSSSSSGGSAFDKMLAVMKSGVGALADTISDSINDLADSMTESAQIADESKLEVRETFPRMPWNDVHAAVSGSAARDVASHVVQRWNHHRLSSMSSHLPVLREIVDDTSFGICARCDLENIFEAATVCPRCQYSLGPISSFIQPMVPKMLPPEPASFSFLSFECKFAGDYGFRILGEGPVVVSGLSVIVNPEYMVMEGQLLESHGPRAHLIATSLLPNIGDVVFSVGGDVVTHLDYMQLARLIMRRRERANNRRVNIVFRRFYLMEETGPGTGSGFTEAGTVPSPTVATTAVTTAVNVPLPVPVQQSMQQPIYQQPAPGSSTAATGGTYDFANNQYFHAAPVATAVSIGTTSNAPVALVVSASLISKEQPQHSLGVAQAQAQAQASLVPSYLSPAQVEALRSNIASNNAARVPQVEPQAQAQAQTQAQPQQQAPQLAHFMPPLPQQQESAFRAPRMSYGDSLPQAPITAPLYLPQAPTSNPLDRIYGNANNAAAVGSPSLDMRSDYASREVNRQAVAKSGNTNNTCSRDENGDHGGEVGTGTKQGTDVQEHVDVSVSERRNTSFLSAAEPRLVTVDTTHRTDFTISDVTIAQGPKPSGNGSSNHGNSNDIGNNNNAGKYSAYPTITPAPVSRPPPIWDVHSTDCATGFFDAQIQGQGQKYDPSLGKSAAYPLFPVQATATEASTDTDATDRVGDPIHALQTTIKWAMDMRRQNVGLITLGDGSGCGLSVLGTCKGPGSVPPVVDPVCAKAAKKELLLSMSHLFHQSSKYADCVNRVSESGTCQVQVLRSVGPWSLGVPTESSIQQCWRDTILAAKHLIYIENQFFISSLGGPDIQNTVADAILERIVRAFHNREQLRVIVVIPQHPNGDVAFQNKPRIVLHYESMTINKGLNSLLQQLKRRLPGVNPSEYIDFYCLRNWGVMNDKVVHDQIYVHDKVLIVDDRVAIVGSANINDRSMLGERDTEMAIRIEDASHIEVQMAQRPWIVGRKVHDMRVRLMRQQINDPHADVVDMLRPDIYQTYWRNIGANNSSLYDQLDAESSPYRCKTLGEYVRGLRNHSNRSSRDPMVQNIVNNIQGFLVMWPLDFLMNEDTEPSAATKVIIPTNLWV